jgi:hypothetical protein
MVWHMVWFKLKDETTEEQKQALMAGLRALPSQIECIDQLAVGEDFSGRSQGYHIGLIVAFPSRAGLEEYGPHPFHQQFVETNKQYWSDVIAFDFETA